jgi:hypothetical protein
MYTAAYPKTDTDGDSNDESGPFPDRGANVKAYGLKYGRMRFGLQDAAVYTGRSFDYEYFISPLPQYFTQYVKGTTGRPWTTDSNENDIIGAFWDWQYTDELMFEAQYLLDDLNMHKLGVGPYNPWKAAWALRTKLKTEYGTFSLSPRGGLQVQPSARPVTGRASVIPTLYYPIPASPSTTPRTAKSPSRTSCFGYKNGENNIAFRLDWENEWRTLRLASYLSSCFPRQVPHQCLARTTTGTTTRAQAPGRRRIGEEDRPEPRGFQGNQGPDDHGSLLVGCAFNAWS